MYKMDLIIGKKLNADAKLIDMEGEGDFNFYLTFTN